MLCQGFGVNSVIGTILVSVLLSKSQYEKVIIICEANDDFASRYCKMILYIQLMISSTLTIISFSYLSLDSEPESCLSNLAGLLVLSEFDNIYGFIWQFIPRVRLPIHSYETAFKKCSCCTCSIAHLRLQFIIAF